MDSIYTVGHLLGEGLGRIQTGAIGPSFPPEVFLPLFLLEKNDWKRVRIPQKSIFLNTLNPFYHFSRGEHPQRSISMSPKSGVHKLEFAVFSH